MLYPSTSSSTYLSLLFLTVFMLLALPNLSPGQNALPEMEIKADDGGAVELKKNVPNPPKGHKYPGLPWDPTLCGEAWWRGFGMAVRSQSGPNWPKDSISQAKKVYDAICLYGEYYEFTASHTYTQQLYERNRFKSTKCDQWMDYIRWSCQGAGINVLYDTVQLKQLSKANLNNFPYNHVTRTINVTRGDFTDTYVFDIWWDAQSHKGKISKAMMGSQHCGATLNLWAEIVEVGNDWPIQKANRAEYVARMTSEAAKAVQRAMKDGDKSYRLSPQTSKAELRDDIIRPIAEALAAKQEFDGRKILERLKKLIQVPSITGLPREDAKSKIAALKLKFEENEGELDLKKDPGIVVGQTPIAGQMADEGETVTIVFNATKTTVPNVIQLSKADAKKKLEEFGFNMVELPPDKIDPTIGKGKVRSQDPPGGNTANVGAEVQVILNPTQVKMPELVGMLRADAEKDADACMLVLQTQVESVYDGEWEPGEVLTQSVKAGKMVPLATNVVITVNPWHQLQAIQINPANISFTKDGQTMDVSLMGQFADGKKRMVVSDAIQWTTDDPKEEVVKLQAGGKLVAVWHGSAKLRAKFVHQGKTLSADRAIQVKIPLAEVQASMSSEPAQNTYLPGDLITFKSTSENLGRFSSFHWFIDGKAYGTEDSFSHTFQKVGRYKVELRVKRERPAGDDVASTFVDVKEKDFIVSFSYSPKKDKYAIGDKIVFTDTSQDLGEKVDIRWMTGTSWQFMKKASSGKKGGNFVLTMAEAGDLHIRLEIESEISGVVKRQDLTLSAEDPEVTYWQNWKGGDRNLIEAVGGQSNLTIGCKHWKQGLGKWPKEYDFTDSIGAVISYDICNGPFENLRNTGYLIYTKKGAGNINYVIYGYDGRDATGTLHNHGKTVKAGTLSLSCETRAAVASWENDDNTTVTYRIWKYTEKGVDALGVVQNALDAPVIDVKEDPKVPNRIIFSVENASSSLIYSWVANGKAVGAGPSFTGKFAPGDHTVVVLAKTSSGKQAQDSISFNIAKKETKPDYSDKIKEVKALLAKGKSKGANALLMDMKDEVAEEVLSSLTDEEMETLLEEEEEEKMKDPIQEEVEETEEIKELIEKGDLKGANAILMTLPDEKVVLVLDNLTKEETNLLVEEQTVDSSATKLPKGSTLGGKKTKDVAKDKEKERAEEEKRKQDEEKKKAEEKKREEEKKRDEEKKVEATGKTENFYGGSFQIPQGTTALFYDLFDKVAQGVWGVVTAPDAGEPDWTVSDGALRQGNNIYRGEGEYDYFQGSHIVTGSGWSNYGVVAKIISGDDDGWGVLFRYNNANNYYRFITVDDSTNKGPFRRLEKFVNGERYVLVEQEGVGFETDELYTVNITAQGAQLTVWLNGTRILSASDATFSSGGMGFMVYANDDFRVEEVLVYGTTGSRGNRGNSGRSGGRRIEPENEGRNSYAY